MADINIEDRFLALFKSNLVAQIVHRDFKPLAANRAFLEMFGFDSHEELLAFPSALDFLLESRRDFAISASESIIKGEQPPFRMQTVFLSKTGEELPAQYTIGRIMWDGAPAIHLMILDERETRDADDALRRSESRLAASQRVAKIGSWTLIVETETLFVTEEYLRILGLPPGRTTIRAEDVLKRILPRHRIEFETAVHFLADPSNRDHVRKVLEGMSDDNGQIQRIVALDTTKAAAEFVHTVFEIDDVGPNGEILSITGTLQDVTENERARQRLEEARRTYLNLFENNTAAHIIWQDGQAVRTNQRALTILGQPNEGTFQECFDFTSLHGRKGWPYGENIDAYEDIARGTGLRHRWKTLHADGETLHLESTFRSVQWDGRSALLETFSDVTAEMSYAEALKRIEERYQLVIRASRAGIFDLDLETQAGFLSRRGFELLGKAAYGHHPFRTIARAMDRRDRLPFLRRFVSTARHGDFTVRIRTASDDLRTFRVTWINPALDLGEPGRRIGSIQDVTEEARLLDQHDRLEFMLRQSQKMETLGQISSSISHEIGNLLQPIVLLSGLSMKETDLQTIRAHQADIRRAALHARDIMRDILMFARPEQGEVEPCNIVTSLHKAVQLAGRAIGSNVVVRTRIPDEDSLKGRHGTVEALLNDSSLSQVMLNLFRNASDAMRGDGRITVSLSQVDLGEARAEKLNIVPGPYFRITVADTGPGMERDVRERIFEPYFTTKTGLGGTGLGLFITSTIVSAWQGAIDVRTGQADHEDFGTAFDIYVLHIAGGVRNALSLHRGPLIGLMNTRLTP